MSLDFHMEYVAYKHLRLFDEQDSLRSKKQMSPIDSIEIFLQVKFDANGFEWAEEEIDMFR